MTQKWQYTTEEGELVEFKCRPSVVGTGALLDVGPNKGKYLGAVGLTDCPDDPVNGDGTLCVIDGDVFATKDQAMAWARERCQYWETHHGAKPVGPQIPFKIVMPMQVANDMVQSVLSEPVSNREAALKGIIEMFVRIVENGNGEFSNDGRDGQMMHSDDVPDEALAQLDAAEEAADQNGDTVEVMTFDTPAEFGAWLRERVASNG